MPHPARARLLYNPRSPRGRLIERIARERGLESVPTSDTDDLTDQAKRAAQRGDRTLFVAGGDGALHHAIQGLAGSECALAVVPAGTGNDLARNLGVPLDADLAVARALAGRRRRIDLGRVEGRLFAGVAGVGLDGAVNRFLAARRRRLRGSAAYAWATLRCLPGFVPPQVDLDLGEERLSARVLIAGVANSPCFGGGMRFAPQARLDDGRLDLVVIEALSLPRVLWLFPRLYRGTHVDLASVHCRRDRRFRLRCSTPITLYADGEPIGPVPDEGVVVEIRPASLWVV